MSKIDVKIRFNTEYCKDNTRKKWRVIVDGVQNLVDDVEIMCKSYTTEDIVNLEGNDIKKWHITALAKSFSITNKKGNTKAIIR